MNELKDKVINVIKKIYDPEIPVNIYELGLIYKIDIQDKKKVNIEKMNIASNILIDEENFKCFAKTGSDVDNFLCNITSAYQEKDNEKLVFNITSNRFLRNMVRSIVGTLLQVGIEKMTINEFKKVIESQNRKFAGPSAPACGLFLYKIKYPSHIFVKSETKK